MEVAIGICWVILAIFSAGWLVILPRLKKKKKEDLNNLYYIMTIQILIGAVKMLRRMVESI